MKNYDSKFLCVSVGGRYCVCCFDPPGSKARRLEYRRAKRAAKREAMKVERENSED